MATFKEKIEEAFKNVDNVASKNGTLPPVPMRPVMPAFCTGKDTTLYIFAGCTVQNNKVYVGREYARTLTVEEQKNLEVFAKQMSSSNVAVSVLSCKI
uniref:Pepsin-I3 domain-containing protein n=1 Tax=Syphacia muris TaxID=451379 RepID=A0A0N5AHM4_9BILA